MDTVVILMDMAIVESVYMGFQTCCHARVKSIQCLRKEMGRNQIAARLFTALDLGLYRHA